MKQNLKRAIFKSVGIGVLSGMRTFSSSAWVAQSSRGRIKGICAAAAGFEMVMDKMPFLGNRISRPHLIGNDSLAPTRRWPAFEDLATQRQVAFAFHVFIVVPTVVNASIFTSLQDRRRIQEFDASLLTISS
jgi:hypothetical protein